MTNPPDQVLQQFPLPEGVAAQPFGSGLINDTWLCAPSDPSADGHVLQRINASVFPRPDLVMENIAAVTGHLLERLRDAGVPEPDRSTLVLVRTRSGGLYYRDGHGACWRLYRRIRDGVTYDRLQSAEQGREAGRCLGRFQALLASFPPQILHDTLPGFHHTPWYLRGLREAVAADPYRRAAGAREEIGRAESRAALAPLLTDALESGRVPSRVVHNDPKVNNVLMHRETGRAICMIDLDTVKPGIVHFDLGDCIRSAANPAGEEPGDLDRVRLDRELYEAVLSGYLEETTSFLIPAEEDLLPLAVRVITYELAVRFLADHLNGDVYFRVQRPGQNLHRCRVQFRLLESIEQAGL